MQKVVHLTTVHNENDNRIFYKECKTLKEEGFDVTLICAGAKDSIKDGIKIIGFHKEKNRIKRFFKTSFIDVIKKCKEVDGDIYHFHDPELIFVGLYLKIKGKKVIYDIHENNPASILSKPYIKNKILKIIMSKLFDFLEKISVNFFDAIVTARPDITKRFKHKNIITLRNFPILSNFDKIRKINITKTKHSVIFVGGMTSIRGINQLIDAFKYLDGVELWLLGPIREKKLKERILTENKNIKYFGVVEAYEIFSYINEADIGVITFLPVPNHLTTLATKPFEYMACGKPIIMSDFDYWKEVFKDSAVYVDPNNSEKIAKAIKDLLNNKDKLTKMGVLNRKLAFEKYNWTIESKKLVNLYKDIIK